MSTALDKDLEDEKPYVLPPFSVLPAGISPTRGIVYVSQALRWSAVVAVAVFFVVALAVWLAGIVLDRSTMWDGAMFKYVMGLYLAAVVHLIPAAFNAIAPHPVPSVFEAQAEQFVGLMRTYPFALGFRFLVPAAASVALWFMTLRAMLVPQYHAQHASGARFLKGRQAMRDLTARLLAPSGHKMAWAAAKSDALAGRWPTAWRTYWKTREAPSFMKVHPDLPTVPKDYFAAGMLISGAPGSGKTQIANTLISQIIGEGPYAHLAPEGGHKALLYDIKKEFTRLYARPAILNPEDKRSMVWDIAKDMADPVAVAAMAAALIKENEKQPFFDRAAKQLYIGCVQSLYAEHGHQWGWYNLANVLSLSVDDMLALMDKHDPVARKEYDMAFAMAKQNLQGGDDSTTVNNIMASLNVAAMVIFKLSRAWGRPSKKAVRFSIKKWVQDDFKGPRQVFIQGTKDKDLRAWITMLFDTAIRSIVHDLDGNEHGRHLFIVVDEFPTLPAADFGELMAVARDRGCVPILMFQDESQLEQTYGPHGSKTLLTMPSMRIYAKMRAGTDGPSKAAEGLGKNRIATTTTTQSGSPGGGQPTYSIGSHTESRALVLPIQLTADSLIGKQGPDVRERWQKWPTGSAIRALLAGIGPHVYRLDWPIVNTGAMKKQANREGFMPADWTKEFADAPTAVVAAGGAAIEEPQPPAYDLRVAPPQQNPETAQAPTATEEVGGPLDQPDGIEPTFDDEPAPPPWPDDAHAESEYRSGDVVMVPLDEDVSAHHEHHHAHAARPAPAKAEGEVDEDDPLASAAADLGIELGLHAVGLGGIAPAVELGKALLEVASGSNGPPPKLDKDGKPIEKKVLYVH
ncbi:type IV secretion system DNA-binding domain-containing protein [Burkholderia cenocepacia]|uniref:type IV secretion system DNA-binding domain-containing protein n=1 Tax=Burkholderia cenocepacia TaxID=95486 RepID=UPI001B96AC44|nr:type IV secretion system DNA-binding domain-containing protein [Burkholderia cenocepacia]MBR7945438.1 type IV secretion system DNA-binding domain-containing protein [Burkholderia cenocepacia]